MYRISVEIEEPKKAMDLLNELNQWTGVSIVDVGIMTDVPQKGSAPKYQNGGRKLGRQKKARQRWTDEDALKLGEMREQDRSVAYMARELGRSKAAIVSKMYAVDLQDQKETVS